MLQEDILKTMYLKEKKSIREIAKELKKGEATILKYLRLYGIPRRPQHVARPMNDFTRQQLLKANLGRKFTLKHRKKLSELRKGKLHDTPKRRFVNGYIQLWRPFDSMSNKNGYVYEHRVVMGEYLKRDLLKNEMIHHRNGIKVDNRLENLELTERKWHKDKHKSEITCPKCQFCFSLVFLNNQD